MDGRRAMSCAASVPNSLARYASRSAGPEDDLETGTVGARAHQDRLMDAALSEDVRRQVVDAGEGAARIERALVQLVEGDVLDGFHGAHRGLCSAAEPLRELLTLEVE